MIIEEFFVEKFLVFFIEVEEFFSEAIVKEFFVEEFLIFFVGVEEFLSII